MTHIKVRRPIFDITEKGRETHMNEKNSFRKEIASGNTRIGRLMKTRQHLLDKSNP